uniref:meprin A subunit beta-like n=1 Tax=Centroberyx gerrardi TaxID=166262 RepID=UPI003AB03ED1
MDAKGVILQAFEHFRLKSCIDFKPRDSEEYYISVRKSHGCSSYVSKLVKGGQVVSIGNRCNRLGTVEHELLHALGFWHEQSRYDRDDHVTIVWENIADDHKANFKKLSPSAATTFNAPYDYASVMHYGKNTFSKNSGFTIMTKLPEYQNVIGQRMEMSSIDVLKLNHLYNCGASISFMEHCDFSSKNVCGMSRCAKSLVGGWRRMSAAVGGPHTDHTSLGKAAGYFMHASTASGQEGDSAWLETKRMNPSRECHVQCLQFYYFHSGSRSDQLNIWIREFKDERDCTGKLRLMGQITGPPTFDWQLHHVPLNAAKAFQVEFEIRKGAGSSSGGFSIDDINLSETECPHRLWKIKGFEKLLTTSDYNTFLTSPRMYSPEGYAFQVMIALRETFFGLYVRLVSGEYDARLEWPCPWRQVTVTMLDQNPHIQQQMSKQITVTTDPTVDLFSVFSAAHFDNPRKVGKRSTINGESLYVNSATGTKSFLSLTNLRSRDFLKGDTAIFLFALQDISSLQHKNFLPCPKFLPTNSTAHPNNRDKGPCAKQ